jgi:hypothetical protein
VIGVPQAQESPERLVILGGDVHGSEMPAPVELGEHDGVEAIGLTAITGPTGNERGSDDLAVEAVVGEDTLEDEASPGGLVAGADGALISETAEESTDLHEIGRERDHLRLVARPPENGGSD